MSKRKLSETSIAKAEPLLKKQKCDDFEYKSLECCLSDIKSLANVPEQIIGLLCEFACGIIAECDICKKEDHIDCNWGTYLDFINDKMYLSDLFQNNDKWWDYMDEKPLCRNCYDKFLCTICNANVDKDAYKCDICDNIICQACDDDDGEGHFDEHMSRDLELTNTMVETHFYVEYSDYDLNYDSGYDCFNGI